MKLIRFITIFFIAQLNISVFSDNIKIRENQIFKSLLIKILSGNPYTPRFIENLPS